MRIGCVGDYSGTNETHTAIANAIIHANEHATYDPDVSIEWVDTEHAGARAGGETSLATFDGIWIAPGSPYRSITGALDAIGYARRNRVPLIGTCAGFQHVVLEYARNVLRFEDAQHAEYDPDASTLFITALSCSLVGQTMTVHLKEDSCAARAYGRLESAERYYCNFGLNPDHIQDLVTGGLHITGQDQDGEPRIIELPDHPFFLATLFVPQTNSTPDEPHPLVQAFLAACHAR